MREEFDKKTKKLGLERSGGNCEVCGATFSLRNPPDFDHVLSCALGGDNSLDNMSVCCRKTCHRSKTREDVGRISKADRIREKNLGLRPAKQKIPSRPFPKRVR